ncbi:MAG: hypothetical protein JKY61_12295 [Planctomycetes bacterium]|nr:hypothetical protein [Planctomycetota bacterium]
MNSDEPEVLSETSSDVPAKSLTTADAVFDSVGGALGETTNIQVAAGSLLVSGWTGFVYGIGDCPVDVIVVPPGLDSVERLTEASSSGKQLAELLARRAHPVAGDKDKAVLAIRLQLRQGLASMEQTMDSKLEVVGTAERLRNGSCRTRLLLQGALDTRALLFAGANQGLVSARNPFQVDLERASLAHMLQGETVYAELKAWFGDLWSVSHQIDDVLLEELESCWALASLTPYEAYVISAHHLLSEPVDESVEVFLRDELIFQTLTEFQLDAVRRALGILARWPGCFISDVVGLGKSFVGAAILKYLERVERVRPIVLCPASLVDMWKAYAEKFDLNVRVFSVGQLREGSRYSLAFSRENGELDGRDFVLVDESHMFRNTNTQRYELLERFIGGDRRALLLTATPMNRTSQDIYNQIKLFHQTDRTELPISPPHLQQFFKKAEAGGADLRDLLRHLLVRRTRRDILVQYGLDADTEKSVLLSDLPLYLDGRKRAFFWVGERKQFFPRRKLETISYSIEKAYGGFYDTVRRRIAPIGGSLAGGGLKYARYNRLAYLAPQFEHLYKDLAWSGQGLTGLMRALLFKRLESSVFAFLQTVNRMEAANLKQVESIRSRSESGSLTDEFGEDAALAEEKARELQRRIPLEHLDLRRYQLDVAADAAILKELGDLMKLIDPREDAKLNRLAGLLRSPSFEGEKVLIFTQFSETAEYLHRNLGAMKGFGDIALCSSSTNNRVEMVTRFAPVANAISRERYPGDELSHLIATDILSEGINLQDARIVINYDLHWNPVRLIQRFGRIDRIGTEHELLFAFNFLPELELEKHLGLKEKLDKRIREIHECIGEDSAILDPSEELNERAMYAIYEADNGEGLGVLESEEQGAAGPIEDAEALLQHIRTENPTWLEELLAKPPGLRAARFSTTFEGVAVLLKHKEDIRMYRCPRTGSPEALNLHSALKLITAIESEPSAPEPNWFGSHIEKCRTAFETEIHQREGARSTKSRLPRYQRTILDRLQKLEEHEPNPDTLKSITALISALSTDLPGAARRTIQAQTKNASDDQALIKTLNQIVLEYGLHIGQLTHADQPHGSVEIVCSVCLLKV